MSVLNKAPKSLEVVPGEDPQVGRDRLAACHAAMDRAARESNLDLRLPGDRRAARDRLRLVARDRATLERHSPDPDPVDLMLHSSFGDPDFQLCMEGDGHPSIVCTGCWPSWEGMDGHTVWPCAEDRAVFDFWLGGQP